MAAYAQSHIIKKRGGVDFLSLSVDICEHATVFVACAHRCVRTVLSRTRAPFLYF